MNSNALSHGPPPSPMPRNWIHHVFPSFHGADVRKSFLSHILKEFKSKGIDLFIDNDIERSKSIGPELINAIRGSRIAIVLLSKNYASSSWCLGELVEIINCKEDLGQTVMVIFYEVDPTDVKKQAGDFGKVFRKTCKGKTKEDIGRWRQALAKVATIAGYHSSNWDNEADMIEKIAADVLNKLINSTPSRDFDDLVGMEAHMEKIERVLRTDLDEVRMIGIWGPAGIGKTTIARCLFNQLSHNFQLSVFMANIRAMYTIPVCSDDYDAKLHLQQKFMSQILNQQDMKIPHLGVAQERLNDKKVLVVLDDVDRLVQLEAMAKETRWFGQGSRIIITTQDIKLFKAHEIKHIYKVKLPPKTEALQIFCMYAFGQKSPKDGFEKLAWEVTYLAGKLPLGLRVMGSYFRGMSKQDWTNSLPRLRTHLHGDIKSVLKFSYDALCDEDKFLFLHIACCFFNFSTIENLVDLFGKTFSDVRQRLHVLADKSLISIKSGDIWIHDLLAQLGREIVRNQSVSEPGKRQFLDDAKDICEVLSDDTADCTPVIGIRLHISSKSEDELYTSGKALEKMRNLQFLRIIGGYNIFYFLRSLNYISRKLRLLDWYHCPLTCLPSNFNPEFLVELHMPNSNLEKLWKGIQPLRNLKQMILNSRNLKELPDLSNAIKLEILHLGGCSSLVKLPSSVGNATNLRSLSLSDCSSLVKLPSSIGNLHNLGSLNLHSCSSLLELPSSIGNATNLTNLHLSYCSSLVELPFSIGKLQGLRILSLRGCSKLKALPINISLESLANLDLSDCSLLKTFPSICTNIWYLKLNGTSIEEVPSSIRSWSRLLEFHMSYFENLKEFPHAIERITDLHFSNSEIKELPPWVKGFSRLNGLVLNGLHKLVSLLQLPGYLSQLDVKNCTSLERLDCSFHNPDIVLNFRNCFKLNQEARDLIIHTSSREVVLPGGKVPAYFTYRAYGSFVTVKLNERPLRTSAKFRACILLDIEGDWEEPWVSCDISITSKQNALTACSSGSHSLHGILTDHLYTFDVEAKKVTSTELFFEFKVPSETNARILKIKECGILHLLEDHVGEDYESFSEGDDDSDYESSDEDYDLEDHVGEDYESFSEGDDDSDYEYSDEDYD